MAFSRPSARLRVEHRARSDRCAPPAAEAGVGLTEKTERVKGLKTVARRRGLLESPTLASAVQVRSCSHPVGRAPLWWPWSPPDQLRVGRSGQRVHVRNNGPRFTAA